MEKIVITFDGGTSTIETSGFKGTACQQATKDLEAALGKTTKDRKTAEAYERPVEAHRGQSR